MPTFLGIALAKWAIGIQVASVAFSIIQSKRMRKKQKNLEEKRKGFELVEEGEVQTAVFAYGRNMLGGTRVWHNVKSDFKYVTPNSDKSFVTGPPPIPEKEYTYTTDGYNGPETHTVTIAAVDDGQLVRTIDGKKNEFLYFQQALCIGPIHAVHDVIFEESRYLDDPSLGNSYVPPDSPIVFGKYATFKETKSALRLDYHYAGGVADAIIAHNSPDRINALFSELAYFSAVIRLDRDDPQFDGVPNIQSMVEGKLIRKVVDGVLQTTWEYSNNPAWCMLDYLLHKHGKNLKPEQIDLPSFEATAAVCDTIVMQGAVCGGKIWNTTPGFGGRSVTSRDIPLYECNVVLNTNDSIRDNIEKIRSTMGDAALVYSQGKYKLLLQYPGVDNANIVVSGTLTDSDIVMGAEIEKTWPSSDNRFNYATVKYRSESDNFKDATVSWPPKRTETYVRGIGGFKYPIPKEGWGVERPDEQLLNNYGVWNSPGDSSTMTWKFMPRETGTYKVDFAADDFGTLTISPGEFSLSESGNNVATGNVALTAFTEYTITLSGTSNMKPARGVAASITNIDNNLMIWSSRSDAYSAFQTTVMSSAIYDAMLAEDGGITLETEVSGDGITDYYHALAKAEELVRTSRSAFSVRLTYVVGDKIYEPGDVVRIQSETLQLGLDTPAYFKVQRTVFKDDLTAELSLNYFDWTQLAWNVADDEYIKAQNVYSFILPAPYWLEYHAEPDLLTNSAGTLLWSLVSDSRVVGYVLYIHKAGDMDDNGYPIFRELGRSSTTPFALPDINVQNAIFGVRSISSTGSLSGMTTTGVTAITRKVPPAVADLSASLFGDNDNAIKLTWTIPEERADETLYDDHFVTFIHRSRDNDPLNAVKIGETVNGTEFVDQTSDFGTLYYWVQLVSKAGVNGPFSNNVSQVITYQDVNIDLEPPPAPLNLTVTSTFNNFILEWEIPNHNVGGGHGATLIYGAPWPSGSPEPGFSNAELLAALPIETIYAYPTSLGTRYVFWAKEQSRGGGISVSAAGPVNATTGKVGGTDLSNLIIEAQHLANNAITSVKIDDNAITAGKIAANAIAVGSAAIENGAIRNALIENLAVDTAKIADGAIVTAKIGLAQIDTANIKHGAITTALIGDAEIKSAKIDFAQIDTLHLGEHAVTLSAIAQGNAAPTTGISLTFSHSNAPCLVIGFASGYGPGGLNVGGLQLYQDSNFLRNVPYIRIEDSNISNPATKWAMWGYTVWSGTVSGVHTYTLKTLNDPAASLDFILYILETKR